MTNKDIYAIRVDANDIVATGHLMRCIPIALALRSMNKDVLFITSDVVSHDVINQYGLKAINIVGDCLNLEKELPELISVIVENRICCLLVDSFYVTYNYLLEISHITNVVCFDCLKSIKYPVQGIISYDISSSADNYDYERKDVRICKGTEYVPLRSEYCGLPSKTISHSVKNILITTGGTDKHSMCKKIAVALGSDSRLNGIDIAVAVGSYFQNKDELFNISNAYKRISSVENMSMADFMQNADIAITAGGITSYELCAYGVPSIVFSLADNQIRFCKKISQDCTMIYVGHFNEDDVIEKITNDTVMLAEDFDMRKLFSSKGQALVDGKGAYRIANMLASL